MLVFQPGVLRRGASALAAGIRPSASGERSRSRDEPAPSDKASEHEQPVAAVTRTAGRAAMQPAAWRTHEPFVPTPFWNDRSPTGRCRKSTRLRAIRA